MDKRFKAAALILVFLLSGCAVPNHQIYNPNRSSSGSTEKPVTTNKKDLFEVQLKIDAPEGYEVYAEQALDNGRRYVTTSFRHTRKIGETPIDSTVSVPLPITFIYAINKQDNLINESLYKIENREDSIIEISFNEDYTLNDDFNLDRMDNNRNKEFLLSAIEEESESLSDKTLEDIRDFAYQADLMLNSPRFLLKREYSKAKRMFDDIERKHGKKLEGTSLLDEIRSLQANLSFLKIGSSVTNQIWLEPARDSIELLKNI